MTLQQPSLSFCAIIKNESANLARCLNSVKPYVDEMIIVDTGSSDDSVAIARQYGTNVSHFEWCDDFAIARNDACSLVSGKWILTLDADEELVVFDQNWTEQFKSTSEDTLAFAVNLRSATASETEMQPIRLFRNDPAIQYRDRYHEHLTHKGQTLHSDHPQVKTLEGIEIIHYGYADDIIVEKSIRRIPILEKIRATDRLSLMVLWTLSGMYEATKMFDKAQSCYEEAWERLLPSLLTSERPEDTRSVRSWLYSLAVRSLQSEDIETSHFICQQGNEWFPDFPPLFYIHGIILKMSESPNDSIPYFEHCIEAGETGNYSKVEPFDQTLMRSYPAFDLGTVHLSNSNFQPAIAAFELALSFDPDHQPAQEQLAIALRSLEQT